MIVLTKAELVRKEQDFWEKVTPIGVVFDIGVAMGFIVGLAICYQVLFAEIADRLPQFATLKAMGHTNRALARLVLLESLYLALSGVRRWTRDQLVAFPVDPGRDRPDNDRASAGRTV